MQRTAPGSALTPPRFVHQDRSLSRARTSLRNLLLLLCLGATLTGVRASASVWDLSQLMQRADELYQPDHRGRIRLAQWQALMHEYASAEVGQQLEAVNRFFNARLRFEHDSTIWGQADYWASPVQSLVAGAADCEDFSIAKYFTLRQLGIDAAQLRLTYVKATGRNQAHMVLAYYATTTSIPVILDNLIDPILAASQRDDLVPVYSFNASGLWLGRAGLDNRAATTPLPRWQELTRKMRDEGFFGPLSR